MEYVKKITLNESFLIEILGQDEFLLAQQFLNEQNKAISFKKLPVSKETMSTHLEVIINYLTEIGEIEKDKCLAINHIDESTYYPFLLPTVIISLELLMET